MRGSTHWLVRAGLYVLPAALLASGAAAQGPVMLVGDAADDHGAPNVYAGLLILGKDFEGHRNITANLGYAVEGDEDEITWGLAAKSPISPETHGIAAGIELLGSFEEAGDNWSVLPGVYMPLGTRNITLKTGLEFGKSDGADAIRANLTLMYRF